MSFNNSDMKVATLHHLSQQESPYQELDTFRRDWEAHRKGATLTSYRLERKVQIDRLIFFGFSVFFFLLGAIIYLKSPNWACAAFFSNCQAIKSTASAFCLILSAVAGRIGVKLCPKKQQVDELTSKAKKNLRRWYKQKKSELRVYAFDGDERKRFCLFLKQAYHHSLDLIIESRDDSLRLIDHITHWPELTALERETLFSQTLFELNDTISQRMCFFKQISISSVKNPAGAN